MRKILVIEDEPDIVRGLRDTLEFEGFTVLGAATGKEGRDLARRESPDCVVLDLMLPDMNGYSVCEEIRTHDRMVPILILTARSQEADKIRGLEAGADDYVTKPFSIGELVARIRALFRRRDRFAEFEGAVRIGGVEVDFKTQTVRRGSSTLPLSFYERELLSLLYERATQPVSRDEILDKIWGIGASPSNRTVDNFIVKLRKKVEDNPNRPAHILTVHGLGYKLVP